MTPKQYFEKHPDCELCGNLATEVHHIYGKRTKELKENPMNFISLCHDCHYKAEFTSVQYMAAKIFRVQKSYGQAFVEFSDRIGHKTWIKYKEDK